MKLSYRRTLLVGFAFFLICAFWQAYDNLIPKILTDKFGMTQAHSGIIMALDNILALFMLPFFGALSDRCRSRLGRRTPFILIGTLCSALLLFALGFADSLQLDSISAVSELDTPKALETLYDYPYDDVLMTPEGVRYVLGNAAEKTNTSPTTGGEVTGSGVSDTAASALYTDTSDASSPVKSSSVHDTVASALNTEAGDVSSPATSSSASDAGVISISRERFMSMTIDTPDYATYVVPARQAYANARTKANPQPLILFIVVLMLLLISMGVFRSPAVALMPDVTMKPLRSKGNAIINLMGSVGGIIILVLGIVFATGAAGNALMPYRTFFAVVAGLMLVSILIFMLTVHEKQWVKEMKEESAKYGIMEDDDTVEAGSGKLSKGEFRSLVFILLSVVMWFMGYNAVSSKYSVYAGKVLSRDFNLTLIIAQAAAIVSYLPVGLAASKVGRKKTILAGVLMLGVAFFTASFIRADSSPILMNAMFALAGVGWATINVNSFPMVVEMCRTGDIGRYTGYYYTASMAAQTVTPYFSGLLMDKAGMTTLFPYATVFVVLAFITMSFVKHGDSKPEVRRGLEALDND